MCRSNTVLCYLFQISTNHFGCDIRKLTQCYWNQKRLVKDANFYIRMAAWTPTPGYKKSNSSMAWIEKSFFSYISRLCQGILLRKPNKWDYMFWWSLQLAWQTNNEISATLQGTWYYNFTTNPVWKGLLECDVPLQRGTFLKTCRGFGALQLTMSTVWCTSRVVNIENLNWCADRSDQGECMGIGSKSQVS